jgi:hypothetical protein
MVTMGTSQPRLPTPACIPKEWPLIVLDLQDCFIPYLYIPKIGKGLHFLSLA